MGFYGNIRNTTSNSFKFDRVYSNRTLMEQHANDDGVFGGRYVLVEYDQSLDENPVRAAETVYRVNYGTSYKYFSNIVTSLDPLPEAYTRLIDSSTLDLESKVYYIKFNNEIADIESAFPVGTVISEIAFTKEASDKTLFYLIGENPIIHSIDNVQISGADLNEVKDFSTASYLYDSDHNKIGVPGTSDADAYTINAAIDRAIYGIGRGYDSTVWRKVYSNDGVAKYVNIADLNSVVPTFAITAEAPYDLPTKPHWDKDSTNVYYNLHLQSPWSFRIADVSDPRSKIKKDGILNIEESNIDALKPDVIYDSNGHYILAPNGTSILDEEKDIHYTPYPGAIYFNRDGFDKTKSTHSRFDGDVNYNQIRLDNYSSGILYPNRDDPNDYTRKQYADTKELSIILPAIGDTVAEMWDKIYGTERKLNIEWDDANSKSDFDDDRLRLVHNDNYSPDDAETLAGVINSAHDLMGMIITDPNSSTYGEKMPNDANEAHQWQIYYNPPAYIKTKDQERQENKTYYTYNENNDDYDIYAENPWPETARPTIYEQISKRNPNFDGNKYYYAGATLGFDPLYYPFEMGEDGVPITIEQHENGITGEPMARTAESFKEYFGDANQGYVEVTGLEDIHEYVNDSENDPIFSNYENGNIFKRVDESIESATAGEVYYNIPTNLTYVAAVMRVNDGRDWFYHPDGQENVYQQLPAEDKPNVLGNGTDYFWLDKELATVSSTGASYVMSVRLRPLFRVWTLKDATKPNIESNRSYDYRALPQFPDYYRRGLYNSFDDILEEEGVQLVQEEIGETTQTFGKKGNTYYDLENIVYQSGTETLPYVDPVTGEVDPTRTITGPVYTLRRVDEILFAEHQITEENPYYPLYKEEVRGNTLVYTKAQWGTLVDTEDLSTSTVYKYKIRTTRLKKEGECYYFKLDDRTEQGQAKVRALREWAENENKESDLLNIKTEGYLDYILEFNINKPEDGLNPNYYYFLAENPPTKVAYGIAEKKSAYENSLTTFYTEKTLYFLDPADELYKKAEKANLYTFTVGDTLYRKNNEYYVIDCGDFSGLNIYQKFNAEIIQDDEDIDYFFGPKTAQKLKKPIKIGYGYREYEWKELYGFARDVNTLHGWLLRLNEILQPGDTRTRDPNTIQGAINQLHDLLERFEPLIPGELYGVNEYGNLGPVALNSDNENEESWILLEPGFDPNTGQMILNIIHNDIYNFSDENSTHAPLSSDTDRAEELMDYVQTLKNILEEDELTEDKLHDPFGFTPDDGSGQSLSLFSPVIDNAGHVVGGKSSNLTLSNLHLGNYFPPSDTQSYNRVLTTLQSPNGDVYILDSDTLKQALIKIANHINAGADNITLNEFYNYYDDIINDNTSTFPYIPTSDTEPQEGKTYYILQDGEYVIYTADPWPTENPPVIYEKLTNVDGNDNINEAIAKLQWQLDHIVHAPLTDLTDYALPSTYDPFGPNASINANDSLGTGLNKLQKQISAPIVSSEETGIINNYAAIIRTNGLVPTTKPQASIDPAEEIAVPALRSGWIWIDTSRNYVYMKTRDGCKGINDGKYDYSTPASGYDTYSDKYDQNFWELLNAWQ